MRMVFQKKGGPLSTPRTTEDVELGASREWRYSKVTRLYLLIYLNKVKQDATHFFKKMSVQNWAGRDLRSDCVAIWPVSWWQINQMHGQSKKQDCLKAQMLQCVLC